MPITNLQIRPVKQEDSSAVARLAGQLGYPTDASTMRARLAALFADPRHSLFIAEGDGQVVGWIYLLSGADLLTGPTAEIGGLVVDQESRGQGIGNALLDFATEWSQQKGCVELRVRSNTAREVRVRDFYLSAGFELVKTQYMLKKNVNCESRLIRE